MNLLSIESIRPFGAEKIAILLDHPLSLVCLALVTRLVVFQCCWLTYCNLEQMREHTADLLQDYLLQADEPSEEALELLQSFDWSVHPSPSPPECLLLTLSCCCLESRRSIEIPDRSEEMDLHRLGALTTAMS